MAPRGADPSVTDPAPASPGPPSSLARELGIEVRALDERAAAAGDAGSGGGEGG